MKNHEKSALDPEQLRAAMRAWSAGVTVVTVVHEGSRHGMTVNSFTSISLDPALITISLQKSTRTHDLVTQSGMFGVTILSSAQSDIADRFAGNHPEGQDRFSGLQLATLVTGSPLLVGGLAWLDCRVVHPYDVGRNTLFISEVLAAAGMADDDPLVYHNRKYWQLK